MLRKFLTASLTALFVISFSVSAAAQSTDNSPLRPEELREVLIRLVELEAARKEIAALELHIQRLEELNAREDDIHAQELELERQKTALREMERDAEQRRADGLQELLDQAHGASRWCVKRILLLPFTFGQVRCK